MAEEESLQQLYEVISVCYGKVSRHLPVLKRQATAAAGSVSRQAQADREGARERRDDREARDGSNDDSKEESDSWQLMQGVEQPMPNHLRNAIMDHVTDKMVESVERISWIFEAVEGEGDLCAEAQWDEGDNKK